MAVAARLAATAGGIEQTGAAELAQRAARDIEAMVAAPAGLVARDGFSDPLELAVEGCGGVGARTAGVSSDSDRWPNWRWRIEQIDEPSWR